LRTLRVARTGEGLVRLRCPLCRRVSGKDPRTTHPGRATKIAKLNLLLRSRSVITLRVVVPGRVTRYVRLGLRARALTVVEAGCLGTNDRRLPCPASPQPPASGPSQPNAGTPAPSGDPATPGVPAVPVAPGVGGSGGGPSPIEGPGPVGELSGAERVSLSEVRLFGWARDADAGTRPVLVMGLVDGRQAGEGRAFTHHPYRFDFNVPIDGGVRTVCAQAINVGGGSDRVLTGCFDVAAFADLDSNGYVSCSDVEILKRHYGQPGGYAQGDLNADGTVEIRDLSIILARAEGRPGESSCT